MQRTFVIGCPHSGTAVVQAMLSRQPAVCVVPQTAFLEQVHGNSEWRWGDTLAKSAPRRLRHRLGFTRKHVRQAFSALHQLLGCDTAVVRAPLRTKKLSRGFIALLDRAAAAAGCRMWLEKTPHHLLYIPEIEALAADARFVHVVRRGADVLASLVDVYLRFENEFMLGGGTVHWARRWNRAMQIHGMHVGRANHHFVFLEDLIRQPDAEWARLCAFLHLPANAPLDAICRRTIDDLENEPWKYSVIHGQLREADRKVESLFGPRMQRWMQAHLVSYDDLRAQCFADRARHMNLQHVALETQAVRVG